MQNFRGALPLALATTWPALAQAAITHIEAVVENTTINGAPVVFGGGGNATTSTGAGTSNDGKWHLRTTANLGLENSFWETDTSGSAGAGTFETTEDLITTITLPGPVTYRLYGHWFGSIVSGNYYDISFRVGSTGSFTEFDLTNSTLSTEDGSEFVNVSKTRTNFSGTLNANTWGLMISDLGEHTLTEDLPTVSIYVNGPDRDLASLNLSPTPVGLPDNNWLAQRTGYEGIGYELVPEPTSWYLMTAGLYTIVAVRRVRRR